MLLQKNYNILKIIAIISSILLGLIFIFSGYVKLYPIESFEYSFVKTGLAGWQSSVILARLMIGLEFACGLLLIGNLWLRRFTLPLVSALLILFNIYLIIQIIQTGNKGNCGCFGEALKFTPLEAILKNCGMLLVAAFVYRFHRGFNFKDVKFYAGGLIAFALAMPFILNPVDFEISSQHYTSTLNYKIDLDILYHDSKNPAPKVELRNGKWIVSFLSLTCPHCRIAAKKLGVIHHRNSSLPIHLILNGDKENLKPFFEDTGTENMSWSVFNGAEKFVRMAGVSMPQIDWVENSMVINKSTYFTLNQSAIEEWVHSNH